MPAICINCQNVIINEKEPLDRASSFRCKTGEINFVTGKEDIRFCAYYNRFGDCPRFIPKK